jgi:hypothetical protein
VLFNSYNTTYLKIQAFWDMIYVHS